MGKVVPFTGAGISINAEFEGKRLADTDVMCKSIASELIKLYDNDKEEQVAKWCSSALKCKSHDKNMCKNEQQSLDQLCEVYTWVKGQDGFRSLVEDVLSIKDFNKLPPQSAHRYISFLAREELIDEIITTNYDCCFEKAYRQTFQGEAEGVALVITDLDKYRKFSGKFYTNSGNRCLKIYKINGCAYELEHNSSYKPESILLMERQLQNWRDRKWARDLFNDCLRSRTLVFSGFGSDEPQVRHTALQIAEEFENTENNKVDNDGTSCWDFPNAPYIATYIDTLSFNQIQILYAYAKAHKSCLNYDDIHSNVFTGVDAEFLGPNKHDDNEHNLYADLFWKKIYQAAFWRQFKKFCEQDSPFYAYLSPCIYPIDALLSKFKDWLAPDEKPFGSFPQLMQIDEDKGVTILTEWLYRIRYGWETFNEGLYLPLVEKPVLLPLVLLMLFFVAGNNDNWEDIKQMVDLENGLLTLNAIENLPIYLVHNTRLLDNIRLKKNIGCAIIICNNLREQAGVIRKNIDISEPNRKQSLKRKDRITIYKLPFRDIFCSGDVLPKDIDSLKRKFISSLEDVKLIITNARPRMKRRAKKIL